MHDTALISGEYFSKSYGKSGMIILDIGGQNVNGSLRKYFEDGGMKYISVDMVEHESVDVVIKPGEPLPFETNSIDLIVSSSCFEHDPCFWLTFKEMTRVTKLDGYIYISVPSNGIYHRYPGDNWRFYYDSGQALAYWSSYGMNTTENNNTYPVKVVEAFNILPINDMWLDYVCVWKRVNEKQTEITISNEVRLNAGPLENMLTNNNIKIVKFI